MKEVRANGEMKGFLERVGGRTVGEKNIQKVYFSPRRESITRPDIISVPVVHFVPYLDANLTCLDGDHCAITEDARLDKFPPENH